MLSFFSDIVYFWENYLKLVAMKLFFIFCLYLTFLSQLCSQSPGAFHYQALLRSQDGNPITSQELSIKVSILSDTALQTGTYSELHYTTTDDIGRINLQVGNGTVLSGIFSEINWSDGEFFIRIDYDLQGGTNFQFAGQSQLLSVPYALYAKQSAQTLVAGEGIGISGDTIINTGDLSNTNELQVISISNDTIFLTDGGFIKLPLPTNAIIPEGGCIHSTDPIPPPGYEYSGTGFTAGDQWDVLSSMTYARFAPVVRSVGSKIYVMGGWDGVGAVSNIVEVFDLNTQTWQRKTNMHTAVVYAAAAVIGNSIHVMGGYNGNTYVNRHQVYNTLLNSWTTATDLPQARSGCGTAIVDGKIFLIGGFNEVALSTTQMYDPTAGTWSDKASMPTARTDFAIAPLSNGIFVVGGWNDSVLNVNEFYSPELDSWFTYSPALTYRAGCSGAISGNKFYLIGGGDQYSYQSITEEYDPLTNNWTVKAGIPSPRAYFGIATINDVIYIAGGNFGSALKTMLEYKPLTIQFYIHCSQ